jgi:hypothetical protein
MRFLSRLSDLWNDPEDGVVKMFRVEYLKEYLFLKRSLGREPTSSEILYLLKAL